MKLLLADDHALFRDGMRHVLNGLGEDVDIVEAGNCLEALALADEHETLELVLLDLDMPDMDGLNALEIFSERHPTLPVVVLSGSQDRTDMQRALDAGAMGYIPKSRTASVMLSAVRLVLSGGVYVPPELLKGEVVKDSTPAPPLSNDSGMSPRQLDVLALLVEGYPNKRIATRLGLSEATVKAHVTAVLRALNVSNRTQAVAAADRMGIVLPRTD